MAKTILIGGTGFLGPILLKNNPDFVAVGRTPLPAYLNNSFFHVPDTESWHRLDDVNFDYVIFLIGSSDHEVINAHPTMAIEKNVIPLTRFLHYAQNRKIKKLIALTTMLQYDSKKMTLPADENQPINPHINNYIFSKFMAEQVTQLYRAKVPSIDVRISNVYGPTHLHRPDIVPTLMWKVIANDPNITVWNKTPQRDFIFADDAAEAIVRLLNTDHQGPVNLGTGVATSVGRLTDIITEISGVKIGDRNIPVSGHMKFQQDIRLLGQLTGWAPKHTLEEGLLKTYNQMREFSLEYGIPHPRH